MRPRRGSIHVCITGDRLVIPQPLNLAVASSRIVIIEIQRKILAALVIDVVCIALCIDGCAVAGYSGMKAHCTAVFGNRRKLSGAVADYAEAGEFIREIKCYAICRSDMRQAAVGFVTRIGAVQLLAHVIHGTCRSRANMIQMIIPICRRIGIV